MYVINRFSISVFFLIVFIQRKISNEYRFNTIKLSIGKFTIPFYRVYTYNQFPFYQSRFKTHPTTSVTTSYSNNKRYKLIQKMRIKKKNDNMIN